MRDDSSSLLLFLAAVQPSLPETGRVLLFHSAHSVVRDILDSALQQGLAVTEHARAVSVWAALRYLASALVPWTGVTGWWDTVHALMRQLTEACSHTQSDTGARNKRFAVQRGSQLLFQLFSFFTLARRRCLHSCNQAKTGALSLFASIPYTICWLPFYAFIQHNYSCCKQRWPCASMLSSTVSAYRLGFSLTRHCFSFVGQVARADDSLEVWLAVLHTNLASASSALRRATLEFLLACHTERESQQPTEQGKHALSPSAAAVRVADGVCVLLT